jgi:hypothetical protein
MGWSGFQREVDGGVQLVGIEDALLDRYPVARLPYAYDIVVTGRAVGPEDAAPTELAIRRRTEARGGFVVATQRSRRRLVTLVYLATADHVVAFSDVPLPRRTNIEVTVGFDPTWERFAAVRPQGIEVQSMQDFAVLGRLLEAGDGGRPRLVEHRVAEIPETAAAGFLAAIEQLGVSVDYLPAIAGVLAATVTHESAPSEVTPVAWNIRGVAERFGARYEGWGCGVVTDRRADPPRRRPGSRR